MSISKRFTIYTMAFMLTTVIAVESGMPKAAIFALGMWAGFIRGILNEEL